MKKYILHLSLFLVTFFTTTVAGVQWLNKDPFELANFSLGLPYSLSLLAILTAHEFGHFFAARYHGVSATLPYFIPTPPFLLNPFGTMGAVIRIRSQITSRRSLFDVGISGPIAGLVVTVVILLYGFLTLPPVEYLYSIHPEYRTMAEIPRSGFAFGGSLLFKGLAFLFSGRHFVPPMTEVYHYPYLCAGWFGLFVTALNLLPVGQLDGGHVLYAISGGRIQQHVARVFFAFLILMGLTGLIPLLGGTLQIGTLGWLVWALILFFVIKLNHPEVPDPDTLSPGRTLLGWSIFFVFVFIFTPVPFWG